MSEYNVRVLWRKFLQKNFFVALERMNSMCEKRKKESVDENEEHENK